jgi:hypothetical protein
LINPQHWASTEVSGIKAVTYDASSSIGIVNSGNLTSIGTGAYDDAYGIQARANGAGSSISVVNSGNLTAIIDESNPYSRAIGIQAGSGGDNSPTTVVNNGTRLRRPSYGICAGTEGANSPLSIWRYRRHLGIQQIRHHHHNPPLSSNTGRSAVRSNQVSEV